jgi:para-nitrobenzyl esterase
MDANSTYVAIEDSGVVVGDHPLGAYHGGDLPFLFDTSIPNSQYPDLTPAQRTLSATMIDLWSRFAATGDPNGRGLPAWPGLGRTGAVLGLASGSAGIGPTPSADTHHCLLVHHRLTSPPDQRGRART